MDAIIDQFSARARSYNDYTVWAHDERLLSAIMDPVTQLRDAPLCLDLGGGTGIVARYGQARGRGRWIVADLSHAMLKSGNDIDAVVADAQRLPFQDQSFDFVAARSLLSYVDVEEVLREIKRVLKPDGLCVIAEKVLGDYAGIAEPWYRTIQEIRNPIKDRVFTTAELAASLKAQMFDVLSSLELRRAYRQDVHQWLSRSGTIDTAAQKKLIGLLENAPDAVRDIGLSIESGTLSIPLSWAVVCGRPTSPRPNPSLVVTVIPVRSQDGALSIYLQERRAPVSQEPEYVGALEFPQGHVDSGETVEAAARRELMEESSLRVVRFYPTRQPSILSADGPVSMEMLCPSQVVITNGRLRFVSIVLIAEVVESFSVGAVNNVGRWVRLDRLEEFVSGRAVYPLNQPMVEHLIATVESLTKVIDASPGREN